MATQEAVILQCIKPMKSIRLNAGGSLDPEQGQEDSVPVSQDGSTEGTSVPMPDPMMLALLEYRIQQLHVRCSLLLKMQHIRRKAENNGSATTEETVTDEDSDQLCELDAIQKELEELRAKKEELEERERKLNLGQQEERPTSWNTETPRGGIYLLPPPELTQENITPGSGVKTRPAAEQPSAAVVPRERLGGTPAVTQCPSCRELVFTDTRSRIGESVWLFCCLTSMIGGLAGCCIIPFFVNRLRDVQHRCPLCQASIHTFKPL